MSKNDTVKRAIHVSDHIHSYLMFKSKAHDDWNELEDFTFFVGLGSLIMFQSSFYFRMIEQTTNRLVDTGVMKYLLGLVIKEHVMIEKPNSLPNVLNLQNLSFGFNIWIGFFCISILIFILEILSLKFQIKRRQKLFGKIRYEKIWPAKQNKSSGDVELKLETLRYFKVKSNKNYPKSDNLQSTDFDKF
ncbi:hypothetical protein ACKWTF_012686 [Chironomus riparius]